MLGTGRNGIRVIVTDSDNLLEATEELELRIKYNHPSRSEMGFENGKRFNTSSETIDGEKVFIFEWSPYGSDLCESLVPRRSILAWAESADGSEKT